MRVESGNRGDEVIAGFIIALGIGIITILAHFYAQQYVDEYFSTWATGTVEALVSFFLSYLFSMIGKKILFPNLWDDTDFTVVFLISTCLFIVIIYYIFQEVIWIWWVSAIFAVYGFLDSRFGLSKAIISKTIDYIRYR